MRLKICAAMLLGLMVGFFVRAQETSQGEAPGTYQLGYGNLFTTNQTKPPCPLMLDTRNGALFMWQGVQAGSGVQGQWVPVQGMSPTRQNEHGIRYTPAPNR